ncbi:MAG: hypothetical protein ACREQ5_23875, partial [Candidatus Dormibacteria bacterium]
MVGPATLSAGLAPGAARTFLREHPVGRGRLYSGARWVGAAVLVAVILGVVVGVGIDSSQAFRHSGISFLWSGTWNPAKNQYAAGTLVVGTLVTTGLAMLIVVPIGLASAAFLSELAPRWLAAIAGTAIELLASVPSIVVGLWALLVLSPLFARDIEPFLRSIPGVGHLFSGPAYG